MDLEEMTLVGKAILISGLLFLFACSENGDFVKVRMLAEWEPQEEIYMGFRTHGAGSEFEYATVRIISELSRVGKIKLIVQDSTLLPEGESFFADHNCDTSNISIVYEEMTYFWIRDPGPIFYEDRTGGIGVADFRFGYYANTNLDSVSSDEIPMELYDRNFAEKHGMPSIQSGLSIEGGGFETNGHGSVILVESIILNRNPGWTKEQIEDELSQKFGVKTLIWLKQGLAEDPDYMEHLYDNFYGFGTGGHSDEFVRFVNDSTIFLAWEFSESLPEYPLREENMKRMKENYSILSQTKDHRGKNFNIVKIPIPVIFYKASELDQGTVDYLSSKNSGHKVEEGDLINIVACAGYLNFIISNHTVIIPKYWTYTVPEIQKERDSQVLSLFEQYFPERDVIQINPLVLNYAGGGMHCIYFSVPLVK